VGAMIDLRAVRTRLGLSQLELARKLGVARCTVNRWERGLWKPTKRVRGMIEVWMERVAEKGEGCRN
jgi:transcriptional regulator with XRE-family HTH domain